MAKKSARSSSGQLKVFRTAIGFHDAYVAVPSMRAALAAWGADKDLFGTGAAERVTDPALTAEPLAHPGEVIRRARGDFAAHLAETAPRPRKADGRAAKPRSKKAPPSRAALNRAEAHLCAFEALAERELADLRFRELALAAERDKLIASQSARRGKLKAAVAREEQRYRSKLAAS